jgi:hypothetical protein
MTFFEAIGRLYTIFCFYRALGNFERTFQILTLKQLFETRWECWLESVKVVKIQLKEINGALIEISESTKIPPIKSETFLFLLLNMKCLTNLC